MMQRLAVRLGWPRRRHKGGIASTSRRRLAEVLDPLLRRDELRRAEEVTPHLRPQRLPSQCTSQSVSFCQVSALPSFIELGGKAVAVLLGVRLLGGADLVAELAEADHVKGIVGEVGRVLLCEASAKITTLLEKCNGRVSALRRPP